jgi:hypothetical protein
MASPSCWLLTYRTPCSLTRGRELAHVLLLQAQHVSLVVCCILIEHFYVVTVTWCRTAQQGGDRATAVGLSQHVTDSPHTHGHRQQPVAAAAHLEGHTPGAGREQQPGGGGGGAGLAANVVCSLAERVGAWDVCARAGCGVDAEAVDTPLCGGGEEDALPSDTMICMHMYGSVAVEGLRLNRLGLL